MGFPPPTAGQGFLRSQTHRKHLSDLHLFRRWLRAQRMCQVCFKNLASENRLFPLCQSTNKAKVVAETLCVEFTEWGSPAPRREGPRQAVYGGLLRPCRLQIHFHPPNWNFSQQLFGWLNQNIGLKMLRSTKSSVPLPLFSDVSHSQVPGL